MLKPKTYEREAFADDETVDLVLTKINQDPSTSSRVIQAETGIPKSTVNRITRFQGLHPYHKTPVHHLETNDFQRRLEMCYDFLQIFQDDNTFLNRLLMSDECTITRDGALNSRNEHHYSETNPHVKKIVKSQTRFKINVWCGIINNHLVGPHFFEGNVDTESYMNLLENHLRNYVEESECGIPFEEVVFHQDGAPAHYAIRTRNFFNEHFRERWIGRSTENDASLINWSARSPDLNPLDFFLWGYLSSIIYEVRSNTIDELRARVLYAFQRVRLRLRTINITDAFRRRIEMCIQQEGDHIENFL